MSDDSTSLEAGALVPLSLRVKRPGETLPHGHPCLEDMANGLGFLYLGRTPVAQVRIARSGDGFAVRRAANWTNAEALARRARRTTVAAMVCKGAAVLEAGRLGKLRPGTEIALNATPETPAALYVPEMALTVALGEVVESGGHYAIRIDAPTHRVVAPPVSQQRFTPASTEAVFASLGWADLTLGDLSRLADGDIVRADRSAHEPVEAWTECGVSLPATIEYRGGRLVLRLLGPDGVCRPASAPDPREDLDAALADLCTVPPATTGRPAAEMLQNMPVAGLARFVERSCALARPVILSLLETETAAAVIAQLTPAAAEAALESVEHAGAAAPTPLGQRLLDEALAQLLVAWAPAPENGDEATERDELARMLRKRLAQ